MKLSKIGDDLLIYCKYEEREFPKHLKGRWDGRLKGFKFPSSVISYNKIIEESNKHSIELNVSDDVKEFFNKKIQELNTIQLSDSYKFKTEPYNYQKDVISLIINKKKCFVFSGVGTGKSKCAIDAASILWKDGKVKKVLVVSPASIMGNFANEIKKHSDFEITIINGSLKKRIDLINNSHTFFHIINYEILSKMENEIIKQCYDMVIFDEIHYCKNRASSRSSSAYKVAKDIPFKLGMSGTIISNNYNDLFQPYKIIDESIFGPHFTKFKDRFFIVGNWYGYEEIIGYKKEDELKKLVATNSIKFDIRDVIKDLPEENNIIKEVTLSDKTMKLYKEMKRHMLIEHEKGDIVASNVLEKLIRLSQLTSGMLVNKEEETQDIVSNEKIDVLKETLSGIDDKAVIFCRFRKSIDRVAKLCEKLGLSYYTYDGRTKDKDLHLRFNTDSTRVWISQIQKSEGYSIPNARYCIFFEMDYSRKNHIQSRGRILRATGSKYDCIFYIYLLATKTVDKDIYNVLKEKDFNSKKALELVRGAEL